MKIGLIAMSGVHVIDPDVAAVGLTLPGFLDRGKAIASLPSLALLTLAGLTDKRHQISYIEVPALSAVEGVPGEFDLVAISSYSAQIHEAYELALRYRALKIPVVIGGPHVSSLPHEAAQYCDAVAIGEGEPIWNQIVADCEAGQLKPFYGSQFSSFEMKDAPMPAFHLLEPSKYNRLTIQTSRGCPHRCEFCAASILITNRYKQKPKEKVLAEIDCIQSIWRRPFIEFADDNSLVNRAFWKNELLPEMVKRDVRWFAETDLSIAEDPELLYKMEQSGCMQVLIGLESNIADSLKNMELRADYKYRMFNKTREAIQKIQSHGIRVIGCFILGLDGQRIEAVDSLYDYVGELGLFDVQLTIQTAFPGTPLYARLKSEGRILEDERWDKCTLFDVNFKPSDMSVDELRRGFINLIDRVYSREAAAKRQREFKRSLRNLRTLQAAS